MTRIKADVAQKRWQKEDGAAPTWTSSSPEEEEEKLGGLQIGNG